MATKVKTRGKVILGIVVLVIAIMGFKFYRDSHPLPKEAPTAEQISPGSQLLMTISGSSVINDSLTPSLVKEYMAINGFTEVEITKVDKKTKVVVGTIDGSHKRVEILSPGTKDGFAALTASKADLCMASAQADDEFRNNNTENVIGLDGIAVITNSGNPIPKLSKQTLNGIFSGTIDSWEKVPGSSQHGKIILYRMGDKTGIYKLFKELVMNNQEISGTPFEKSAEMTSAVAKDPVGIGFVSFTFLNAPGIKSISIVDGESTSAVPPNALTIASEKYPLCRRLYMYRTSSPSAEATKFAQFVQTDQAQKIVENVGFVSLQINNDNEVNVESTDPPSYRQLINSSEKITTEFRFATGKATLDTRGYDDVDRLTNFLGQPQYRRRKVTLVGFADNSGNAQSNQLLSLERANTLKSILADKGIQTETSIGMGILRPARENNTPENMSFNRRVEVWISKQ